jgi:hypothetical protein
MSGFKGQLKKDLSAVFHNAAEFADLHFIDGAEAVCVVHDDDTEAFNSKHTVYTRTNVERKTVYVADSLLTNVPIVESVMELDGTYYTVKSVTHECGETIIKLERNT